MQWGESGGDGQLNQFYGFDNLFDQLFDFEIHFWWGPLDGTRVLGGECPVRFPVFF